MVSHYFPHAGATFINIFLYVWVYGNKFRLFVVCLCVFLMLFVFSSIVVVPFRFNFLFKCKFDEQPLTSKRPRISFFSSILLWIYPFWCLSYLLVYVCVCVCASFFHYCFFGYNLMSNTFIAMIYCVRHIIHFKLLLQIDKHLIIVHLFPLIYLSFSFLLVFVLVLISLIFFGLFFFSFHYNLDYVFLLFFFLVSYFEIYCKLIFIVLIYSHIYIYFE